MTTEKTVINVTIAGEEYTIRAEATPEYTRECARYVDQTITDITRQSRSALEPHKAAILAALALADQLLQARSQLKASSVQAATEIERLSAEIEARLAGSDLAARS